MTENTIGQIKNEYQAAGLHMLPDFIRKYESDTRAGVQKLIAAAHKQLGWLEAERERIYQMGEYERQYAQHGFVCGIDEAGRGPLSGPVVAGAVILPKDSEILYLNDSKQLSAKKREELYEVIINQAAAYGIGIVSCRRIDEINILQATYEAMREAINNLGVVPDILLNDAVTIPGVKIRQVPIIKGDAKSVSIAAASILAKVTRDRMMEQFDQKYPEYGFAANKGYGSKAHIEAVKRLGPCEIHRKTFITHFVSGSSPNDRGQ